MKILATALVTTMSVIAFQAGREAFIMHRMTKVVCFVLVVALSACQTPADPDTRLVALKSETAARFAELPAKPKWEAVDKIELNFATYHPQGLTKIGEHFYLTSVKVDDWPEKFGQTVGGYDRSPGSGEGYLFKFDEEGRLLQKTRLGEDIIYHPGGIDYDGRWLWVPVAEYRPDSASIIYRIDPDSLDAVAVLRVDDHIGDLVRDVETGTLNGLSWGSRRAYAWGLDEATGDVIGPSATSGSIARPRGIRDIDYQDCQYVGGTYTICGGLTSSRNRWGGLDLVDLDASEAIHQVPVPMKSSRTGRVMTTNPVFVEAIEDHLRFYFAPDDNQTTLFVYDAFVPESDLAQRSAGPETLRLTERFYIIGHRGIRGLLPENTLVSFEEAIDLGADVLEMDLHMTANGEIVVYHDPTLNPDITRNSQGKWLRNRGPLIKDLTMAELRTYDVGGIRRGSDYAQQFPRQKSSAGARIPTLREVVRLAKSKSGTVKFYLEIKTSPVEPYLTPDPAMVAEAVIDVLRDEDVIDRAYLNSADWRPLLHAREAEPRIGLIMTAHVPNHSDNLEMGESGRSPWLAGFDFDDYGNGYADTSRLIVAAGGQAWSAPKGFFLNNRNAERAIKEAHAGGVSIFVWTVNSEREMRKLIRLGVDGIVSDRPDLLRRQAERHAGGKYHQTATVVAPYVTAGVQATRRATTQVIRQAKRTALPTDAAARCERRNGVVRSRRTENPTDVEIMFVNNTDLEVYAYWIDYQGSKQLRSSIKPGESAIQSTYPRHPWLISDGRGKCLDLVIPTEQPRTTVQLPTLTD